MERLISNIYIYIYIYIYVWSLIFLILVILTGLVWFSFDISMLFRFISNAALNPE